MSLQQQPLVLDEGQAVYDADLFSLLTHVEEANSHDVAPRIIAIQSGSLSGSE